MLKARNGRALTGRRFREAAVGASCARRCEGCSPGAVLLKELRRSGFSREKRGHALCALSALHYGREDRWYHVDFASCSCERGFFILRRIVNERGT